MMTEFGDKKRSNYKAGEAVEFRDGTKGVVAESNHEVQGYARDYYIPVARDGDEFYAFVFFSAIKPVAAYKVGSRYAYVGASWSYLVLGVNEGHAHAKSTDGGVFVSLHPDFLTANNPLVEI